MSNNTLIHRLLSDGTQCEDGWIGFRSSCFYFHNIETLDYTSATSLCRSYGSEIVSILSEDEDSFLKETKSCTFLPYLDNVYVQSLV